MRSRNGFEVDFNASGAGGDAVVDEVCHCGFEGVPHGTHGFQKVDARGDVHLFHVDSPYPIPSSAATILVRDADVATAPDRLFRRHDARKVDVGFD